MRTFGKVLSLFATVFAGAGIVAAIKKPRSVYMNKAEEKNPMQGKRVRFVEDPSEPENADGMRGHLEIIGDTEHHAGIYEKVIKRILDIILSFGGLVILSPVFLILSIWIWIDDPGPILFAQKRVGKDKQYFKLHKFRSMKMNTPRNVPTHTVWIMQSQQPRRRYLEHLG